MTIAYSGDNITFPDASTQNTAAKVGMVNRIINGAMVIDQRNAGASVAITTTIYCPDRYQIRLVAGSGHTAQTQTSVVPTGFSNALKITVGTGASPTAAQNGFIYQGVEGYNTADLQFGTANAQTITVSFWVRSSVTGTYGFTLGNNASTRSFVTSYTVIAANTWEYKTITIPGDTSGTWEITNSIGLQPLWDIGQGSTSSLSASASWQAAGPALGLTGGVKLVATTGATWYLTGVQLEKGSTATSFDYRPYGTELALCQRYYWQISENDGNSIFWIGAVNSALSGRMVFPFNMRSTPTVTFDAALYINDATANALVNAATARTAVSGGGVSVLFSSASSVLTLGRAASLYGTGSTTPSFVGLSSEL